MSAKSQLNLFDSESSSRAMPLPEHVNYGMQGQPTPCEIPEIDGLYYFDAFLDEDSQRALIQRIDTEPWRTDLERRVQQYGWRYDYQKRTVTPDMELGPLPDWVAEVPVACTSR